MLATHHITPRHLLSVLLVGTLFAIGLAVPAGAGELVLETENDFLTQNQKDDLYTFSVTLGWQWDKTAFRLRENAFTDREASRRFDETYLTVGRELPLRPGWTGRAEAGVAHVGKGLFGESAQNAVHRVIGDPEVDLDYIGGDRLHPYGRLEIERVVVHGSRLASGPVVELQTAPGFKSSALVAWRAEWDTPGPLALQATAGGKWADTELGPLVPWISRRDAYASLEIGFWDRFVLTWSYNAHGTAREHMSLGYRLASWGRGRTSRESR